MSDRRPYFPFFVDITGAKGLIIGGGKHAYEKIIRMQPFGADITAIASEFLPEIENMEGVTLVRRAFKESDLVPEPDFVVVASDDTAIKAFVSNYCRERRIPVNVVDDAPYCSYIYPAMITKGPLSIGISTGGASPAVASILKEEINRLLPDKMDEILDWLESLRPALKERIPDGKTRAEALKKIAREAMERNDVLEEVVPEIE